MNYVILNDTELFENKIQLNGFKQVDLNGQDRIDAIFCHLTKQILEDINQEPTRRDSVLQGYEFLRNPGIFALSKIDRDILYSEDTELIETMFGLFDQESFYIEVRGFNRPESYNQIDQYIFVYNKKLGFIEDIFPDNIEEDTLQTLLNSIEKKIL